MMGMMGSSMAGSMAGSVIGHGISNMMFGGGSSQQEAPPAQEAYPQQAYQPQAAYGAAPQGGAQGPCAVELESFFGCLQQNNNDQQYCQAYLDQLQYCRQTQPQ